MLFDLATVPGWDSLSSDFCNQPVRVTSSLQDPFAFIALVELCGRLNGHEGDCDSLPPVEDINVEYP